MWNSGGGGGGGGGGGVKITIGCITYKLYQYCFVIFFSCTGKGIPNELKSNSRAVKLPEGVFPYCKSAVSKFGACGGQFT